MVKINDITVARIKGSLWGAIVGDALGARYEFLRREDVVEVFNGDLDDCHGKLEILGEGPHDVVPGQFTDDSELMLAMLNAINDNAGEYNEDVVSDYYLGWYNSQPFDIGKTTKNAFGNGAQGYDDIIHNSKVTNSNSKSNGFLMRSMPLAFAALRDPPKLLPELAQKDCPLTNPHESCVNAMELYITAICYSILGMSRENIYKMLWEKANNENKQILIASVKDNIENLEADGPNGGYYGVALQIAFHHFFNKNSFDNAMISTILLGGDVDTNCCILGGLLGTRANVSRRLVATVQNLEEPNYDRFRKLPFLAPQEIRATINALINVL